MNKVIELSTRRVWVPVVWCPRCECCAAEDHVCPAAKSAAPENTPGSR